MTVRRWSGAYCPEPSESGGWVKYADHVAALAAQATAHEAALAEDARDE